MCHISPEVCDSTCCVSQGNLYICENVFFQIKTGSTYINLVHFRRNTPRTSEQKSSCVEINALEDSSSSAAENSNCALFSIVTSPASTTVCCVACVVEVAVMVTLEELSFPDDCVTTIGTITATAIMRSSAIANTEIKTRRLVLRVGASAGLVRASRNPW